MARIPLAGAIHHYVELRRRVLTPNDQGEQAPSWPGPAYATEWMEKNDLRGQKRYLAHQFIAEQMTEFTMRFRSDMVQTDRLYIAEDDEFYEILQMAEIGRRQGLDLLCRRIAP